MGNVLKGTVLLGDPMLWQKEPHVPWFQPQTCAHGVQSGVVANQPLKLRAWASPGGPGPCCVYPPGRGEGQTRGQSLSVTFSTAAGKTAGRKDEQEVPALFPSSRRPLDHVDGVSEKVTRGLNCAPQQTG